MQPIGPLPSSVDDAAFTTTPSSEDEAAARYSLPSPMGDAAQASLSTVGFLPSSVDDAAVETLLPSSMDDAAFDAIGGIAGPWQDVGSLPSPESDAAPSPDSNPLDVVYEIVVEQSQLEITKTGGGWVDVQIVVDQAGLVFGDKYAPQLVLESLDTWESFGVMRWIRGQSNRNGQFVKFQAQPYTAEPEVSILK